MAGFQGRCSKIGAADGTNNSTAQKAIGLAFKLVQYSYLIYPFPIKIRSLLPGKVSL